MNNRKLINEPDTSTFEKAFSNAARLPTAEDRKKAMEQSFRDVIREDLHRDSAYQPPSFGAPRSAGRNGWQNEIPLSAPPGLKIIDAMLPVENAERAEARRMLERLLRDNPNHPQLVAAKAALAKEEGDDAA
jgi:hypothetical protein